MPYKGWIPANSRVEAELQLGATAGGTALVAISFADNGGGAGADSTIVAPGASGQCSVNTNAGASGLLRVWVDMNADSDVGQLLVYVNGSLRNSEAITGDTPWSYSFS